MLKPGFLLLAFCIALSGAAQTYPAWQPAPGHISLPLWPQTPPGNPGSPGVEQAVPSKKPNSDGIINVSVPTLTVYAPPAGKQTGAAALVFPGGGYRTLAINLEGTEIADWLNSLGMTAIIVKYRVPDSGPYPAHSAALEDAQRALGMVREHAAEWHLDPHRIGVIGFSAGANLGVMLSNHYAERIYPAVNAADSLSSRPDFNVVIYPFAMARPDSPRSDTTSPNPNYTLDPTITVDPAGPPVILVQTEDDPQHVENCLLYYLALKRAHVPAEMHLYAVGRHGYGLRPSADPVHVWPQNVALWFQTIGILK